MVKVDLDYELIKTVAAGTSATGIFGESVIVDRVDCGNEKIMPAANVKWCRGRSCGCLQSEHIEHLRKMDIAINALVA